MAGEKEDAITCLTEAKWKLEKLDESADTMSLKAQILSIEGQLVPVFQDAMACFNSALLLNQSLLANAQLESDNDYVIHTLKYRQGVFLLNKGMIQFYNGVATDAINAFTTSASIFQELHSQNSAEYIACQNNIAMCQMNLGNYSDAINILNHCCPVKTGQKFFEIIEN
jgi:tetratricopeptide (TPR) repeat protein